MPKYIIEREIPGVGSLSLRDQKEGANQSCNALEALGPGIEWEHSYICGDKTFCVYIADNKELIHEHAEISGIPVTRITEVETMHDPSTAQLEVPHREGDID